MQQYLYQRKTKLLIYGVVPDLTTVEEESVTDAGTFRKNTLLAFVFQDKHLTLFAI